MKAEVMAIIETARKEASGRYVRSFPKLTVKEKVLKKQKRVSNKLLN